MKKFDPKIIPYLAAITTALMLMRAAVEHFGVWGWVIGPLAGLVTSFSLATAGSNISDIAAKRKPLAYTALLGMILVSPVVIALSDPTPDAATWAWAIFPDAAILLASAVTGKSLLAKDVPQTTQVATSNQQVAGKTSSKKKATTRKSVKEADLIAYLQANKQASQQEVADHFGVTRSAIGQRISKLVASGKIKP
jgi:hypothetical protein